MRSGSLLLLMILVAPPACRSGAGDPAPESGGSFQRALERARAGDLEAAEREMRLHLRRSPRDARAHEALADLYLAGGRVRLAAEGYRRALLLDPSRPHALYNLGTLLLEAGDALEAARLLERACELEPENARAHVNLGRAYFELGLPELAADSFQRALELDPALDSARENLALLAGGGP